MTITDFLLARIAEDEAHATRVPTDWLYPEDYPALEMTEIGPGHTLIVSPTRVLAECQAKRAIVELYEIQRGCRDAYRSPRSRAIEDEKAAQDRRMQEARTRPVEDAVRHLAAVYADHPDYREE